jgi:hypothetical protein
MPDEHTRADAERLADRIIAAFEDHGFELADGWLERARRDAITILKDDLDARDAALRDAGAEEREACAQIADLYAANPPSAEENNTQAAFGLGMDHMAGCMDAATFIAEAIRDPARLTAVPDPRSIPDAAAERGEHAQPELKEGEM